MTDMVLNKIELLNIGLKEDINKDITHKININKYLEHSLEEWVWEELIKLVIIIIISISKKYIMKLYFQYGRPSKSKSTRKWRI